MSVGDGERGRWKREQPSGQSRKGAEKEAGPGTWGHCTKETCAGAEVQGGRGRGKEGIQAKRTASASSEAPVLMADLGCPWGVDPPALHSDPE